MGEAIHVWEQIKTNLIRHRHEDGLQILIAALISAIMYAIGAVANNRLILSDASKRLGSSPATTSSQPRTNGQRERTEEK